MDYETWEHFEMVNTFRSESLQVSSEWLMISQNEEYERFLLAEYDKQFK